MKLGDFGGAREYRTADQMTTMVGTPIYMVRYGQLHCLGTIL